ncbi:MAG: DUF5615 family PIN-like protein [Planctomycetia bacterium]|nr:DUF5615 family PIN-like protein [Planctomycetia bacterium]
MKLLANENFPRVIVEALAASGYDIRWVRSDAPGIADEEILQWSVKETRVLLTFDKDFGELTFRSGKDASAGVIPFRIKLRDLAFATQFVLSTFSSRDDWDCHFSVISYKNIRMHPLP